jgi:hypothetical protein
MPWHQEAKKEVEDCCKLRGAVNQALIRRYPNGETLFGKTKESLSEYIGLGSKRRELKHLSSARKRKRSDSLSSGERKGKSLNLYHVITCLCCGMGVVRISVSEKQLRGHVVYLS